MSGATVANDVKRKYRTPGPCAKCGNEEIQISHMEMYWCECERCRNQSQLAFTHESAIAFWNRENGHD